MSMSLKLPTDPRLSPDLEPVSLATAEEGFLAGLGRRVRGFRNRRGMTRKMLAAEANVSERHLAQLETGDGNISVLLLQRIATALSVSIGELFMDAHVADRETAVILKRLERLPAARRREIVARI